MTTALYLSGDALQMVSGERAGDRLRIRDYTIVPMQGDALINGVITNEAAVRSAVDSLKGRRSGLKTARLVIDSSLVLVKQAVVPILSPKRLQAIACGEMEEFEDSYEDLLYDYAVINGANPAGQGGTILCSAVEQRMVESYVKLFDSAGIKLVKMDIALCSLIRLANTLPELQGGTFLLSVLDGNNLLSALFDGGAYLLSSRSRIMAERGSAALSGELTGRLSSLLQFHASQRSPHELRTAYFGGLGAEEASLCGEMSAALGIEVQRLSRSEAVEGPPEGDGVFSLADALYVTGALL